ncbi:MAG: hypothetical protein LJE67_05855 [Salaquimonas sp.]|jgi:hypothetical protein|nr:hypothetical protein [Salaquimonas sp.]
MRSDVKPIGARGAGPVFRFLSSSGLLRSGLPILLSLVVLPNFIWPNYKFVERDDGGFHYRDYKGSPYDQLRTGDPRIDQIECPPSQRPFCGG